MKIFSRTTFAGFASAILMAGFLSGCGPSSQSLPPQVVSLGCPVNSDSEMQRIFSGVNGVDGMRRPLNDHGVPVDVNGNCLSTAPVPEVFSAAVDPVYVGVLQTRYHYVYVYNPTVVHVYSAPGVMYRTTVPTGKVILQTTAPAGVRTTVAVPAGNTTTVRPGAPAAATTTTVAPGATTTVRPGAPAAATTTTVAPGAASTVKPGAAPTAVGPSTSASPTPSTSVAPAAVQPAANSSVTPPKATAPTTTFNRPAAVAPTPAVQAPPAASVTPPKASAPTSTFVRPGKK